MEENGLELLKVADKFNLHQLKGNFQSKEVIETRTKSCP